MEINPTITLAEPSVVKSPGYLSKMELLVSTVQQLSLAKDLNAVMRVVREVAREITGADGATFILRDKGYCYYAEEDAISPLWKGNRFPMETCISGWVMENKQAAFIRDIYEDDRVPADVYKPTFVKSLAMVPIRSQDPIGAIGNYWAYQHQPTQQEITLLQALADITAVSIENIEIRNHLKEKLQERTQMYSQLKKQKLQLEEFTHIIAHNMRAPLSNLMLLNDLVETSKTTKDKIALLEKQRPVLDFLHETFEELVNATQVKKDFNIHREYLDLNEYTEKVINLLQGEISSCKAAISYNFSKVKHVYYPKAYMESLLFNLISNSLKYRSPERTPEIKLSSYKKGGWIYLNIDDNGLGIDLNQHARNLFKLRKTFHDNPNAKGFGLFITKNQVEAMGGTITVNSIPNQGSTFTIKLNKPKK